MTQLYNRAYKAWWANRADGAYYMDPLTFKVDMYNVWENLDKIADDYQTWETLSQLTPDELDVILKDQVN